MWLPTRAFELFRISRETFDDLREEAAALKAEARAHEGELASLRANNDFYRIRINQLELERAQLLEKAYGVKTVVPEIVGRAQPLPELTPSMFEDMGEVMAKQVGLPAYN